MEIGGFFRDSRQKVSKGTVDGSHNRHDDRGDRLSNVMHEFVAKNHHVDQISRITRDENLC